MRTVFVNPERCIGCRQCEIACAAEHSIARELVGALAESPPPRARIHVEAGATPGTAYPNRCRHCDPAPCLAVCPTGAIYRDTERDLVLIDDAKCIGCAMCAIVCPFDVITYHPLAAVALAMGGTHGRAVAVKCDGCVTRLGEGREPACVEVCKAGALTFGDINEFVETGRKRQTIGVLAASVTATGEPATPAYPVVPDTVKSWRALGAAAASVGQTGGTR